LSGRGCNFAVHDCFASTGNGLSGLSGKRNSSSGL
jgi:hypothetical protein